MGCSTVRVIQVFAFLTIDGAESRMMDIYRYIDRNRIQFDFIKMNNQKNYFDDEIRSLGGRIFEVTHPRTSIVKHIIDMYRVFKDNGPFAAVHTHTSYHSALVLAVAFAAGIKRRVCHARTTSTTHKKNLLLLLTLFISRRMSNMFSTSRLAISMESAKFIYGKSAVRNGKVEIIPNAINLDNFLKVVNLEKERAKQELGIEPNKTVMGHVGRFSIMKNHFFLLRLVVLMKKIMPDICLVCVGDGELRDSIKESAVRLGIEPDVKFLGLRKDIPFVMRCFDVFVFPSLWEGLGGAVIEAQAAGISCIASDNLPGETDMGLGLIEYASLTDEAKWVEAILRAIRRRQPELDEIKKAFDSKGFTLENSSKHIISAYGIERFTDKDKL